MVKRIFIIITLIIYGSFAYSEIETVIGSSYSENPVAKKAVEETYKKVVEQIDGKPDLIILGSDTSYSSSVVLAELKKLAGKKTKVWGMTSSVGIASDDGWHHSEAGSIAMFGIKSPYMKYGVSGSKLDKDLFETGKKLATEAAKDAAKDVSIKPSLVLFSCSAILGKEQQVLKGIEDVWGKDVLVLGGSSASNTAENLGNEFANFKSFSNGASIVAIYSHVPIGWAFQSGFLAVGKQGVVTKAKETRVYEIDNKPAVDVYNEWTDGLFAEEYATARNTGKVVNVHLREKTALYPLAKVVEGQDSTSFHNVMHTDSVYPDGSMSFFLPLEKGQKVVLVKGSKEILISRPEVQTVIARAKAGITKDNIAGAFQIYCTGARSTLSDMQTNQMITGVKENILYAPFCGIFTAGEQGYFPGIGNVHANLVSSMIIFRKK